MEEQISDDTWHESIQRIYSSSVSLRHTVIQFKTAHRLHWSKDRLAQILVMTEDIELLGFDLLSLFLKCLINVLLQQYQLQWIN